MNTGNRVARLHISTHCANSLCLCHSYVYCTSSSPKPQKKLPPIPPKRRLQRPQKLLKKVPRRRPRNKLQQQGKLQLRRRREPQQMMTDLQRSEQRLNINETIFVLGLRSFSFAAQRRLLVFPRFEKYTGTPNIVICSYLLSFCEQYVDYSS